MKLQTAHPAQPSPAEDVARLLEQSDGSIGSTVVGTLSVLGVEADWAALGAIVRGADPRLVARLFRPRRVRRR